MAGLVSEQPAQGQAKGPAAADDNLEQKIRARIEKCWPRYFPSLATRPAPEIVCHRSAQRGFSVMFEYELKFARPSSEHVLVKVRRDSRFGPYLPEEVTQAPGLLRLEFDELTKAHRSSSEAARVCAWSGLSTIAKSSTPWSSRRPRVAILVCWPGTTRPKRSRRCAGAGSGFEHFTRKSIGHDRASGPWASSRGV